MELDYFKIRLLHYMREHGFDPEHMNSEIVSVNAENANDTFERMRRAGSSVDEAVEMAVSDLFIGIGDSPREVLSEILLSDFDDRLHVSDQLVLEFWIGKICEDATLLDKFRMDNGIGLDPEKIEESGNGLHDRIDQFLITHGL